MLWQSTTADRPVSSRVNSFISTAVIRFLLYPAYVTFVDEHDASDRTSLLWLILSSVLLHRILVACCLHLPNWRGTALKPLVSYPDPPFLRSAECKYIHKHAENGDGDALHPTLRKKEGTTPKFYATGKRPDVLILVPRPSRTRGPGDEAKKDVLCFAEQLPTPVQQWAVALKFFWVT